MEFGGWRVHEHISPGEWRKRKEPVEQLFE
jgi:hypothetical protein